MSNEFKLNFNSAIGNNKESILFIHPLGADNSIFDYVITKLKHKFNCFSVDIRGHGKSPITEPGFSIREMAKDISYTFNFDKPVNVMGVSIGGMIAMNLAIYKLIPIDNLILSDTGHKIGDFDLWQQRIDLVNSGGLNKIVDMALERWFPKNFRDTASDVIEDCKKLQLKTSMKGYIGACQAIQNEDLTGKLSLINQRTLVVNGSEDISTPPKLGKELANRISGASFKELKGIGHVPPLQDPDLTAKIIQEFILR